jgi:hypothetical protein
MRDSGICIFVYLRSVRLRRTLGILKPKMLFLGMDTEIFEPWICEEVYLDYLHYLPRHTPSLSTLIINLRGSFVISYNQLGTTYLISNAAVAGYTVKRDLCNLTCRCRCKGREKGGKMMTIQWTCCRSNLPAHQLAQRHIFCMQL